MKKNKIKVGSDFSGVGAFDQALKKINIDYQTVYACDWDKYSRQTYIHNYGEPKYFPMDVYGREIPEGSLDIYMTSPPCQAFSLAGKRKGEEDERGILFYNSHEFILKNKPRYFIIENVKGLLSDDGGKTFQRWLDFLGGKSVNGNPVIFPMDEATPYHVYWQVLNAKDYGIPQNRERVFIIGIRDDADNDFTFPKPFPLEKRLKDVLEKEVDEKYFLSDKALDYLTRDTTGNYSDRLTFMNDSDAQKSTCITANHSKGVPYNMLKIKSATKQGYEIATENDSINFSVPNSETRRGRVGKGVAQTLDTNCKQGILHKIEGWYSEENKNVEKDDIIQTGQTNMKGQRIYKTGISPTLPAENPRVATVTDDVKIAAIRGRNPENPSDRTTGAPTEQRLEINQQGVSNTLTSVQKDNVVVEKKNYIQWDTSGKGYDSQQDRAYYENGHMGTIPAGRTENKVNVLLNNYRIRRLTVRECFRLMDFPDTFTWPVSDSQAYKQAGNSIVVNLLTEIINKLKLNKPTKQCLKNQKKSTMIN